MPKKIKWYIGLDRHPSHFDRDRKVTSVNWPDIVDLRVVGEFCTPTEFKSVLD